LSVDGIALEGWAGQILDGVTLVGYCDTCLDYYEADGESFLQRARQHTGDFSLEAPPVPLCTECHDTGFIHVIENPVTVERCACFHGRQKKRKKAEAPIPTHGL
jgi:hypothetical protein